MELKDCLRLLDALNLDPQERLCAQTLLISVNWLEEMSATDKETATELKRFILDYFG
jgi:hypothetical protein